MDHRLAGTARGHRQAAGRPYRLPPPRGPVAHHPTGRRRGGQDPGHRPRRPGALPPCLVAPLLPAQPGLRTRQAAAELLLDPALQGRLRHPRRRALDVRMGAVVPGDRRELDRGLVESQRPDRHLAGPGLQPPRTRLRHLHLQGVREESAAVRPAGVPRRRHLRPRPPLRLAAAPRRQDRRRPRHRHQDRQQRQSHLGHAQRLAQLPPHHGHPHRARRPLPDPRQGGELLRPLPPRGRRRKAASAADPLTGVGGRRGLHLRPLAAPLGLRHPPGLPAHPPDRPPPSPALARDPQPPRGLPPAMPPAS